MEFDTRILEKIPVIFLSKNVYKEHFSTHIWFSKAVKFSKLVLNSNMLFSDTFLFFFANVWGRQKLIQVLFGNYLMKQFFFFSISRKDRKKEDDVLNLISRRDSAKKEGKTTVMTQKLLIIRGVICTSKNEKTVRLQIILIFMPVSGITLRLQMSP